MPSHPEMALIWMVLSSSVSSPDHAQAHCSVVFNKVLGPKLYRKPIQSSLVSFMVAVLKVSM
jgi:hypothetical protein